MKDIKHIFYKYETDDKYFIPMNSIQFLLVMEDECLFLNWNKFHTVDINDFDLTKWQYLVIEPIQKKSLWETVKSKLLQHKLVTSEKERSIGRVVEITRRIDEPQALIKFSNKAIIHIYQCVEGYGDLNQYFRYITPNETQAYKEAIDSMYEFDDEDLDLVYREMDVLNQ